MRRRNLFIIILCSFCIFSCTSIDFEQRVVQQGNLLPESKIDRLKLGMSKQDVAILMGTSLLSPVFNTERWDYAYSIRQGNGPNQIRNARLYFKNERLIRIQKQPQG
tara:strand:- start:1732 stop:2052 length:321 start_codon:yes stop_codon:yes gene_type:complete